MVLIMKKYSADEIKEFIIKHYQYFGVGLLFICLVVVLLIFSQGKKGQEAGESVGSVSEGSTSENAVIPVPETDLEVDAHADVNSLVDVYFTAMATGDVGTLAGICSELDDTEQIRIQKKAEYTENYQNFTCYTKPGPVDDSYIAFVYYEIKFKNIDTLAPGLTSLYVRTNDDGSLYVYDGELSEEVNGYIKKITTQDDVVELLNQVDTKYSEAAAGDASLKSFMEALPAALDEAVSTELAARQSQGGDAASGNEVSEGQGDEAAPSEEYVQATDTVNIRKSPSETGDKIDKAVVGDVYKRLQSLDNGWSRIEYNGAEAYVKSDYLKVVSADEAAQVQESASEQESAPEQSESSSTNAIGTVTVKETVRIRQSASTSGEQLGSAYQGEKFDLIMEMEDGWCKILYKGNAAYVKADYVEISRN